MNTKKEKVLSRIIDPDTGVLLRHSSQFHSTPNYIRVAKNRGILSRKGIKPTRIRGGLYFPYDTEI